MARHNTKPKNAEMARFFKGLGKEVKSARMKQGLSQAKVAEAAEVDIRHYQDLEAGHVVSLRLLWSVANALGVSISRLTNYLGPAETARAASFREKSRDRRWRLGISESKLRTYLKGQTTSSRLKNRA